VPDLTILVVTANANIETVVEVMRAGAYDYVTKPLDRERFLAALSRALERVELLSRVREMARRDPLVFNEIVGVTPAIRELNAQITNVLDTDIAVCITGESGTGKELVARAVHAHGRRRKGPFVAVNCASIPTTLQESELFGHERGAFTGALATHRGRFEQAHGGTLFLDEIGEMGLPTQAILLRTLESKTIRRVGGVADIPVNVRVLCATHRDLQAEVRAGRFRDDLYFRLVVYPIAVPPLRDRLADVPLLVAHVIRELRADVGRDVTGVSPEVLDALMRHDWPGNVRELRNVVHRAMVACKGDTIELADLQPSIRDRAAPLPAAVPGPAADVPTLREMERDAIAKALAASNGNVTKAAKMLGLGRATLYRRIAELQLTVTRAQ
jgi:DNA-binding NtrC family response regulator